VTHITIAREIVNMDIFHAGDEELLWRARLANVVRPKVQTGSWRNEPCGRIFVGQTPAAIEKST
jgi:hypothetical protein